MLVAPAGYLHLEENIIAYEGFTHLLGSGTGGIQRYLLDLLRYHDGKFESHLLVLSDPGPLSVEATQVCESVEYIGMKNGLDLFALLRIKQQLQSLDYDLIHSHINNVVLGLALKLQDKPIVFTEHGGRLLNRDAGAIFSYRYLSSSIDRFIAISQFMAELMCAENPSIRDRLSVIYNGVDCDHISNAERSSVSLPALPEGKTVGFTGRLTLDKGIDLFIETARRVIEAYPGANFVVIGDGPEKAAMQQLVAEYNLQDSFVFLGYRKDAREIASTFDLCLFTSRYEGFGLVIVEALAAGVPVVAMHERSAVQELIRDGIDGVIVTGLRAQETADQVVRLLQDDELRSRMSAAGKERASRFTMENNASAVAREYIALSQP